MLGWAEHTFVKESKIQSWQDLVKFKFWLALAKLRVVKGCEIFIFWCFCDNLLKNRFVACMFWCMPSTFMRDWAIWSLYWVLWLLLGVFTNLCCEIVDVRKRQWIISKNKINRSINQSILINQLFDKIIDQSVNQSINQSIINEDLLMTEGGKEKKEFRVRLKNVAVTKLGG